MQVTTKDGFTHTGNLELQLDFGLGGGGLERGELDGNPTTVRGEHTNTTHTARVEKYEGTAPMCSGRKLGRRIRAA